MKRFILTLSVFLGTLASYAQIPNYIPTNGLIAFYGFDGNTNDLSPNGNNGINHGASFGQNRFGQATSACSFNGSSYISMSNSPSLQSPTSAITLSAWVYVSQWQVTSEGKWAAILCKSTSLNSTQYRLTLQDTTVDFIYGGNQTIFSIAPRKFELNRWYFVAVTSNGLSSTIYINDSSYSNIAPKNTYGSVSNQSLEIGRDYPGTIDYFTGLVDEIGIWNRQLTSTEINHVNYYCYQKDTITLESYVSATKGLPLVLNVKGKKYSKNFTWQSNPSNMGWITVDNNSYYNGSNDSILTIANIRLSNHFQQFRIIGANGACLDTSNTLTLNINDTFITTIYDTSRISVSDTLVINATLTGLPEPNNKNLFKVYPNPASSHLIIDNGNWSNLGNYRITIINNVGQTVFNENIDQQQFNINLSTWTGRGIYFIQIIDPSNTAIETKKILIE
jgi:hypothetical protein